MKIHVLQIAAALAVSGLAACGGSPATPAAPTAAPPPMANKLIVYGDTVLFGGKDVPDSCTEKSRFKHGESVGFRMTAVDPLTGKVQDDAKITIHLTIGGKAVDVPMKFRGTGPNPHPGMWTGKWVVPNDAPTGIVKFVADATDKAGRSGEFQPFQVDASELAVVQ